MMKFVKGIVIGSAVTATAWMLYSEGMLNKKRIMKQYRKLKNQICG